MTPKILLRNNNNKPKPTQSQSCWLSVNDSGMRAIVLRLHSILLLASPASFQKTHRPSMTTRLLSTDTTSPSIETSSPTSWIPNDPEQAQEARQELGVWPLDEYNAALLNEVHPRGYIASTTTPHVRLYRDDRCLLWKATFQFNDRLVYSIIS